ncbi:MAG: pitrilysin family protein, partial [Pseudomonadota bacterium]
MIVRRLVSSWALALSLGALAACGDQGPPAAASAASETALANPVWPHDASDLAPDPAVTYGQLDNGMRYIIMENDTPTETAALRMRIDAGSLSESEDQRGLSHFLEHMAFNGSTNVPEGEMIKILERFGLAFGPDTNAFTSFDQIQYQLDLPSVDDELIETGLFLMRETASNLTLDAEAIDKERGIIASEERLRNSFGLRRFVDLIGFLAPDTTLAKRLPIGDLEVIATAPPERFRDIYEAAYRPESTTLVAVGDFDAADMAGRIDAAFGDWQGVGAPGTPPVIGTVNPSRPLEAAFFHDPDVPTFVTINAVKPAEPKPDTLANRRASLLRTLGNGIVSRRFASLSRAPDAVFLNAGAGQANYFDILEIASIDVTTTPENWQAALAIGEQELRRAIDHGFSEAELKEQIANLRTGLKTAAERAATRKSTGLANSLANAINENDVFT